MLAQMNQEVEDIVHLPPPQVGEDINGLDRPRSARQKEAVPLCLWWLPRLKCVSVSQQGYSWKGEEGQGGVQQRAAGGNRSRLAPTMQ